MVFKLIVMVLFALVLFSLGSALLHLIRDRETSDATIRSLSWRIGLSLFIFILLMIGFAMGWIQPHGIGR